MCNLLNPIFVLILVLPLTVGAAKPGRETKAEQGKDGIAVKSLPSYEIVKVSTDASLKKTEAAFEVRLVTREGKAITQSVRYSYNGIEQKPTSSKNGKLSFKVKPGKYKLQFFYNEAHAEVYTDSIEARSQKRVELKVYFDKANINIIADKPVIYLYPENTTEVKVELNPGGEFLFTYPVYNNGWTVTAHPDGTLQQADKTFKYLFWEGRSLIPPTLQAGEGFVKTTNELTAFFEEKLAHLGLNSIEIQDFITYWVPRMQSHEKHLVRFIFNEAYNPIATIQVCPQPDQMIRVFMVWSPLEKDQEVKINEPQLPALQRKGFTLVEWGGTEVKYTEPLSQK